MAREYLSGDRSQGFLLPPDMAQWLPGDHEVWFVIDTVAALDLSGFERQSRDLRGRRGYDPVVLATVLIYAYCVGERSSRRIERRCWEDVAFRVAAANLRPDHTTLSRFAKDHAEAFEGLFVQVLRMAQRMGMGQVGAVSVDGTKMAADASAQAARTSEAIVEEVARITREARDTDAAEDDLFGSRRGDELPEDLVDARSRRARLAQAAREIQAEDAKDAARPPARRANRPRKANVTDPQARVVKGPRGFFWGYNAQAVATQDGLIVAADVTQDRADNDQYLPMVDRTLTNLAAAGMPRPDHVLADNGYWSNTNVTSHLDDPNTLAAEADLAHTHSVTAQPSPRRRPKPLIPPRRDKRRAKIPTTGPVPPGATPSQILERTLAPKHAKVLYKLRATTIEPIFGQIKAARGITSFRRRGLAAACHEWSLIATTHNIRTMWRHTTRPPAT